MFFIWRIIVCCFYIFMNNVIANKNCVPTFFYVPDFPQKIYRLEHYNVTIQIKLGENDLKNCGLKINWSLGGRFEKKRPDIVSDLLNLKTSVTNITLDASSIPIERIFKIEWWIFSVNLIIPHEETLEYRKPFQWALNYLKIVGGQKRTAFISDGDLILDVTSRNIDRIFTHNEKKNLLQYYTWMCLPNLIFVKNDTLRSSWVVEQNKLSPIRYHCYVNVTLFINKAVDVVHIGNQYAYQFISVQNKPLTDFYLHCMENCDSPKAEDDILLEVKCSDCQEEDIVWEITESQNLLGKINRRSKRIQIEGGTFKPGSNVTLTVSDSQKRFSRIANLRLQPPHPPTLIINCEKNCGDNADVTTQTVFNVTCTPNTSPLCDKIEWGRPNATGHKPYWYDNSVISKNKAEITFKRFTFKEGERPVITAFAGDVVAAFDSIRFKTKKDVSFELSTNNNQDIRSTTLVNVRCIYCLPEEENRAKERQFSWTFDPKTALIANCWSINDINTILTIKPNCINIPITKYKDPVYAVTFFVTHEGKTEQITVNFKVIVPNLSWTCEPKLKPESEPPKDTLNTVFNVTNQCAYRQTICTIICLSNCDHLSGFEWFITTRFQKAYYTIKTTKLTSDTISFVENAFSPGELFTMTAQLQGVMYPLITLNIHWTGGIGNKYTVSENCQNLFNPWVPQKFTVKCTGENCGTCLDPINIDYRSDDFNVTKNAAKDLLHVLEDRKTFLIPAFAFRLGESVTIYVGAAGQNGKEENHCKINFGFKVEPTFEITCISNCNKPCDPELPLNLHVTCIPDKSSQLTLNCQELDYNWWLEMPNKTYPLNKFKKDPLSDYIEIPKNVLQTGVPITINIDMRTFKAKKPYEFKCSSLIPKLKVTCFPLSCEGKPAKWPTTMDLQVIVECIENCLHIKNFVFQSSNVNITKENETGINSLKLNSAFFRTDEQLLISISNDGKVKAWIKKTFKFYSLIPEFKIKCIYNCDSKNLSDPRLPVKLVAHCIRNCQASNYAWTIREKPNHPDYLNMKDFAIFSEYNLSCTIKANTFKHRYNLYSFYVLVTLSNEFSPKRVTYKIYYQEPKSEIVLECLQNCNQSNPFEDVKLQVKCMRFCQVQQYTWELTRYPVGFDWNKHIRFDDNKRNFTILANTFKNKDKVKIICYIGAYKNKTVYEIHFKIPEPEIHLECIGMNCGDELNPHLQIDFEYKCLKNCNEQCKFKWKLQENGNDGIKDLQLNKYATVSASKPELTLKPHKFPNNTCLLVVLTGCGITIQKYFLLSFPEPNLVLNCETNCNHNPKKKTVYTVDCIKNCDGIVYLWDLKPPPKDKKWKSKITLKEKSLTIPSDMYEYDDNVTISVTVFETSKQEMINFHEPYWEGKCDVIPGNGVAALTKFSVECTNFVKSATYYIFQEVKQKSADELQDIRTKRTSLLIAGNSEIDEIVSAHVKTSKLGVLLNYTNNLPVTPLYLASCQKAIIVGIGRDWRLHAILRLSVNASPINSRENINSSSSPIFRLRRSYDDEGNNVSIHEIINLRLFHDVQILINEKLFHEAFQILAALDTDLCLQEPAKRIRHYRKHFLRVLRDQLIEQLHPVQGISFYWKMLQCKCEKNDAFINDFISENLLAANLKLENLLQINRTYLPRHALEYYIDDCLVAIELLLDCSIKRYDSVFTRDIISPDYVLKERLIADEERELYHFHFMSNQIVQVVESTLSLGLTAQNTPDFALHSSLVNFITFKSSTIPKFLKLTNDNRCYISFHAFLEGELKSKRSIFLFAFGVYEKNIFWWDGRHFGDVFGLPIAHLLIQKDNQTVHKLTSPLRVHFQLNKKFNGVTVERTIRSLKVFRIRLKPNSLVIITIQNSNMTTMNMTVSVSDVLHSQGHMQQYFISITSSLQHLASGDTLFLSLYSENQVVVKIRLMVFSCLSWNRLSWAWERNTCDPDYAVNELICSCSHLSLFTATQDIVKLEYVEHKDTLTEMFYFDYHIYVIVVSVGTLILFLLLLFLSRLYDTSYLNEDGHLFISDNIPGDKHLYIIVVTTGLHVNAGTTAVVGIQLHGKCGKSRRHLLNPPGLCRKVLQRNRVDCFLMYSPINLGVITRLRLWHNSGGNSPQWCCERIVVQYYRKPEVIFVFEPRKWLSLIARGSGNCHCSIPLKVKNCQPVQNMTWIGRLRQSWLDQTIDLCFLFYRKGSNFKCEERIATATATTFAAMITAFLLVRSRDHLEFSQILCTSIVASLVNLTLFALFIKSSPRDFNQNIT